MDRILHQCSIPTRELPADISTADEKWSCPECHQRWLIRYYGHSSSAKRLTAGIKNIWWQAKRGRDL